MSKGRDTATVSLVRAVTYGHLMEHKGKLHISVSHLMGSE